MEVQIDLSREYGIVLEGGGAKGAYQIGAWKALREAGLRIKGIAGVSVGALNGALICMDDLKKAEEIWGNIEYSQVMDVNDETIRALKEKDFKALNLSELLSSGLQLVKDRGFDVAPLKRFIEQVVGDGESIRSSDREFYAVTYSVSDKKELIVDLRAEENINDMLLASAYFMAFKNEKLGGKRYMDGGGFNNVPINVLLDRGYEDIIVIRIYGLGFDRERVTKIPEGVRVYHIAPRQDLGGILEFDKKQARKNMNLGYYDAKRFLYGLSGRMYYIDAPYGEDYYFDRMMSEARFLKNCLKDFLEEEEQEILKKEGCRVFTEELFPRLAARWKLKEGWDYKDMYLAILEELAKKLKIKRFFIYTVDGLWDRIRRKLADSLT